MTVHVLEGCNVNYNCPNCSLAIVIDNCNKVTDDDLRVYIDGNLIATIVETDVDAECDATTCRGSVIYDTHCDSFPSIVGVTSGADSCVCDGETYSLAEYTADLRFDCDSDPETRALTIQSYVDNGCQNYGLVRLFKMCGCEVVEEIAVTPSIYTGNYPDTIYSATYFFRFFCCDLDCPTITKNPMMALAPETESAPKKAHVAKANSAPKKPGEKLPPGCGPDLMPDFLTKVKNYRSDTKRWKAAGKPIVSDEVIAERRAICNECPCRNVAKDACSVCGCGLQTSILGHKLARATSECPIGKWQALVHH